VAREEGEDCLPCSGPLALQRLINDSLARDATYHHVRVFVSHRHLLNGFLAGHRLRGETLHSLAVIVVSLGDRGVLLVALSWAHTLVLVIDLRGGLKRLLQTPGPVNGGQPPGAISLTHPIEYLHKPIARRLPPSHFLAEDRLQRDGRLGGWVQRWREGLG